MWSNAYGISFHLWCSWKLIERRFVARLAFADLFILTLYVPSNSEWVASHSPSNFWAKRSKVRVGQEKPNKNAHLSTINIAVLPSLSDTVSLSPPQFIQNQAPIPRLSHQLYARCHHPWKASIYCFRKLIFLRLAIIFSLIWMSRQCNRKWWSSLPSWRGSLSWNWF